MREWKLAEAKNKFSEVVERAVADGPQIVTRSGRKVVVVMDYEEYRKQLPANRQSFVAQLMAIPPAGRDDPDFVRLPLKVRKADL